MNLGKSFTQQPLVAKKNYKTSKITKIMKITFMKTNRDYVFHIHAKKMKPFLPKLQTHSESQ